MASIDTDWASRHVALIEELSHRWHLSELTPAPHLSYSYVLLGHQKEKPIALKLSSDKEMITTEARALRAFQGHGVPRLLEEDIARGALLLERLTPGTTLKELFPDQDEVAIQSACQVMEELHQTPLSLSSSDEANAEIRGSGSDRDPRVKPEGDSGGNSFPHIKDWLAILDKPWDVPGPLLTQARVWRDELLATQGPPVLLHGDLHHDNILKHNDTWMAIDPKGVIGERAYEVCAFLRNPLPTILNHPHLKELTARRIALFSAKLNIPTERLWKWHFVQCILAACWMCEDGTDPTPFLMLVEEN